MGLAQLDQPQTLPFPLADARFDYLVFGSSGYLGRALCWHLVDQGHMVMGVTRTPYRVGDFPCVLHWDGKNVGVWAEWLDNTECVVNLAGRSVNCRYNEKNKAEITSSRLESTRAIGQAIAQCTHPPSVWLNSSTATIYRDSRDRPMEEESGEIGKGF